MSGPRAASNSWGSTPTAHRERPTTSGSSWSSTPPPIRRCSTTAPGWADGQKVSKKDDGTMNTRHTPTMLNAAYATSFYWEGRAPTLEKQIGAAWRGQMGAKDELGQAVIAQKIAAIPGYRAQFLNVF